MSFWYDYFAAKQILDDRAATIKVGATSLDSRASRVSAECLSSLALSQSFNEICGGKCSSTKCLTIISVTKGDHLKYRIISIMEFCIAVQCMPLLVLKEADVGCISVAGERKG